MIKNQTPHPDSSALDHSEQLVASIKQEIQRDGPMPFARFMELALYAPGLGYYSSDCEKFGKAGDFTTAPEISALYSRCIAKQCQQVLALIPGDILEFGAGTGIMAANILLTLEQMQILPKHYYIMEVSSALKERQKQTIAKSAPHLLHKVLWLNTLNDLNFQGAILANEILDAFPVHRFKYSNGQFYEYYVHLEAENLKLTLDSPSLAVKYYVESLSIDFPEDYSSECNLLLPGWITAISELLEKGLLLIVDYGFPRSEFYHPDRSQGTLMCHYRHQVQDDPLTLVGSQDITTHIDFTSVAEAGVACGLTLAGFTNQANFLLSCGITDDVQIQEPNFLHLANEIKVLTSPNEMGELFKVMALTKSLDIPLLGFSLRNIWQRL